MRYSIRSLLVVTASIATAILVWQSCQPMNHFKIVVSGEVASRLEPGSRLMVWNNSTSAAKKVVCDLDDLPLRLPTDAYLNQDWNVSFYSPSSFESLCCVTLPRSLFDKPRRINVKLDAPSPVLRPCFEDWRYFRYTPNISQRMCYRDLPFWNESLGRLTPNRSNPVLRVVNVNTGSRVHDEQMTYGCMGSRWYSRVTTDLLLRDFDRLKYSVVYDSGGLFDVVKTEFELKYQSTLHGDYGVTLR